MTLRPATAADDGFLRRVHASTRADELAPVPWPDEAKAAFLDQQFDAQATHYRAQYPGLEELVVVDGAEDVGRLSLHRGADELRVLDIALLPPFRRRGTGTAVLTGVLAEAAAAGVVVVLHVGSDSPARRLYARLGFVEVEQGPVHNRLEWRSAPGQAKTAS